MTGPIAPSGVDWFATTISDDGSHHLLDGKPLYEAHFDEVLTFHTPGLAPVRRGLNAWHIRPDGSPAYERRFLHTFGFYERVAAVLTEEGWCHIRPDASDAYPDRYAWCGNFQGGRCTVRLPNGSYFHITASGAAAYQNRWRYAGDYSDGRGVVQGDDGTYTHIDLDGKAIHGRWFLDLDVFHKRIARARDDGGWLHVDFLGNAIYSRRFAMVEPFYNGQARVETFDGSLEVIDEAAVALVVLRPATGC
ncbi:MAG: methyltransferase [Planctomycetota bacterium]|nr:methyltransferase [Planctomycetota bacterium]